MNELDTDWGTQVEAVEAEPNDDVVGSSIELTLAEIRKVAVN